MKIAISGKMRSGKDEMANYLTEKYNFLRVGFADYIKEMAKDNFKISEKEIKEKPKNIREFLQLLGKAGRAYDENFWVKKALEEIEETEEANYPDIINFVIPDLRFQNEAKFLKKRGFFLVRVNSERNERLKRGKLSNENDISEIDLDCYTDFDFFINNNLDKKDYYKLIDKIMKNEI